MTQESNSSQQLTFCDDCGCLRLRDVTNQLQQLFTKRSVNSELCGICNKCVGDDDRGKCTQVVDQNDVDQEVESGSIQQPVVGKSFINNDQHQAISKCESVVNDCPVISNNCNDGGDVNERVGPVGAAGQVSPDFTNVIISEQDKTGKVIIYTFPEKTKSSQKIWEKPLQCIQNISPGTASGGITASASTTEASLSSGTVSRTTRSNVGTAKMSIETAPKELTQEIAAQSKVNCEPSRSKEDAPEADTSVDQNRTKAAIIESDKCADDKTGGKEDEDDSDEGGKTDDEEESLVSEDNVDAKDVSKEGDAKPNDYISQLYERKDMKLPGITFCSFSSDPSKCASSKLVEFANSVSKISKNLNGKIVAMMGTVDPKMPMHIKCRHCTPMGDFKNRYKSAVRFLKHVKQFHAKFYPDVDFDEVMKEPYKCDECDQLYAKPQDVYACQNKHALARSCKCEYPGCNKTFRTKKLKFQHAKIHGVQGRKGVEACQNNHADEREYKCEHPGCNKTFKSSRRKRVHAYVHAERRFMCTQCGRRFGTSANLKDHTRWVHLKLKPFICERCGKASSTKRHMETHIKTVHDGLRTFTCEHCGKSFGASERLQRHINRIHLKLKPHLCAQCGRTFACKVEMKIHMRVHTGEKPYKCEDCDYQCSRPDYLVQHRRTHTREKPYHCDICNKRFRHRTQFVVHRRKKHGINESGKSGGSGTPIQQSVPPATNVSESSSAGGLLPPLVAQNKTAVQFLQ